MTPYERKDIGLAWPLSTREIDLILCRYSAAWSAALLGDAGSAAVLKSFVRPDFPWPEDALKVATRGMAHVAAIDWQAAELAKQPETLRLAIIGAGAIGDPALAPWLMEQMTLPKLARSPLKHSP